MPIPLSSFGAAALAGGGPTTATAPTTKTCARDERAAGTRRLHVPPEICLRQNRRVALADIAHACIVRSRPACTPLGDFPRHGGVRPMSQEHTSTNARSADRYVVISSDCHAGASIPMYAEYLEAKHRDDFVAWETSFVNPYQDLLDTQVTRLSAQLRQPDPPAAARERRHRRRGHLPEHHPAVLPERHPHAAGPDSRAVRAAMGRDPRAQPLVGRLLQRAAGPARRRRAAPAQRRR